MTDKNDIQVIISETVMYERECDFCNERLKGLYITYSINQEKNTVFICVKCLASIILGFINYINSRNDIEAI